MRRLVDSYGRHIDYLRISITDRCNLNCRYCAPFGGGCQIPHTEILTFEEIVRVAEAAVLAGISKVRLTGGEPLVRKRIEVLCRMLANIYGLESLTLTTNGVLLREMALPLFEAGLRRINVSLDTLNPERFKRITGRNLLSEVICGINKAEDIGFYPIKINTVVMRGVNDDEVQDLARLTLRKPYHVRFIELMPIGGFSIEAHRSLFVPVEEIFNAVKKIGVWRLQRRTGSCGPARLCTLRDAAGSVGFIAPISWHFCYSCNRMRLTADGKLKPCLFSGEEIDIKEPLREGASLEELADIFVLATTRKPRGHLMEKVDLKIGLGRAMQAIGG